MVACIPYHLFNEWSNRKTHALSTRHAIHEAYPLKMPICIECRYPVNQLYTIYSAADDRSLGKGVRLTQCPRCKRFADKYVEHDFVVLFIDLVLIKPQVCIHVSVCLHNLTSNNIWKVYRHLLFNRLEREDDKIDVSQLISFSYLCSQC